MELLTFKTLWGYPEPRDAVALERACGQAVAAGFDGVEGPVPLDHQLREAFAESLAEKGLHYIAEVCTAGSYVPERSAAMSRHLADLEDALVRLAPLEPLLVNCLGGCDRWDVATSCEFFQRALALADKYAVAISFETHRGRSLYSPWVTEQILERMTLPLTCDFSHWCVVCEGLGSTEDEMMAYVAGHARHVHGRVGYDQGSQVSDPADPRYREDLQKHLRWWQWIWQAQRERGEVVSTLTPEFGPDGYQMILPATGQPYGSLDSFNAWMAARCRRAFTE